VTPKNLIWLTFPLVLWMNRSGPFLGYSLLEMAVCLGIGWASVRPVLRWLHQGMQTIPAFESYSLMHFPYYFMPYMAGRGEFLLYPESVRLRVGCMVVLYLLVADWVFLKVVRRWGARPAPSGSWFLREVKGVRNGSALWWAFWFWCAISVLMVLGWMPNMGGAVNVVRSMQSVCGSAGSFFLSLRLGAGQLRPTERLMFNVLLVVGVFSSLGTGFLVGGTMMILTAVLGYTIGSGRVPVWALAGSIAFLSFLHQGKSQMRERFWDAGKNYSERHYNPFEVYGYWMGASYRTLTQSVVDSQSEGFVERASLLRMLMIVGAEAPEFRPYLNGKTYLQIPQLFVPRILWPQKPRASLPMDTLGIYFGVHTQESADSTAIGFGHVAEAWANFGWVGVVLAGGGYALLMSAPAVLSLRSRQEQAGYLLGVVLLGQSLDLENAVGTALTAVFQKLLLAVVVVHFFSRRAVLEPASKAGPEAVETNSV
jgi:hypothetical protein